MDPDDTRIYTVVDRPAALGTTADPDVLWSASFSLNQAFALDAYEGLLSLFRARRHIPLYQDPPRQRADVYDEAVSALRGDAADAVRRTWGSTRLILSTAVPVQSYKQVLGALMLSQDSRQLEEALRQVQLNIIEIFALALTITVLLSFYLARTLARPIRRLAAAAERVRHGHHRQHTIPDFSGRGDG